MSKPYVVLKGIEAETVEVRTNSAWHPQEKVVGHAVTAHVYFPDKDVVIEAKLRYPALKPYEISEEAVMKRIREVFRIE